MAKKIEAKGKYGKRGKRISTGRGWRLLDSRNNTRFVGSLLKVVKVGSEKIAIFRLQEYSN
jgi:hypothetical protein